MNDIYLILILICLVSAFIQGRLASGQLYDATKKSSTVVEYTPNSQSQAAKDLIMLFSGLAATFIIVIVIMAGQINLLYLLVTLMVGYWVYLAVSTYQKKETASKKETEYKEYTGSPPIYRAEVPRPIPQPRAEPKEDEMTKIKNWEWYTFRDILIKLSQKGPGKYIAGAKRPDYIHLDGLLPTVAEMRQISSKSHNRESSRVVFADTGRSSLVISGITRIGTTNQVKVDMQPEPGRENVQIPVMTIHVHPGRSESHGLSDIDYISFLSDQRQIIMMILYEGGILFAMKTSVTMTGTNDNVQRRIADIRKDVLRSWPNIYIPNSVLAFNKAVCLEFGMTLYRAPSSNEDVAHRIDVTNL